MQKDEKEIVIQVILEEIKELKSGPMSGHSNERTGYMDHQS